MTISLDWIVKEAGARARDAATARGMVDYAALMKKLYGVKLEGKVTNTRARTLFNVLAFFEEPFIRQMLRTVEIKDLGPIHGRWRDKARKMELNEDVFTSREHYGGGHLSKVTETVHVILHEFIHALDEHFGFSKSKKWLGFSGWVNSPKEVPEGYARYEERRPGWRKLKNITRSNWVHKKDADFVRRYASRNPYEDFTEHLTFYIMGLVRKFKGNGGKKKLAFVRKAYRILAEDPSLVFYWLRDE